MNLEELAKQIEEELRSLKLYEVEGKCDSCNEVKMVHKYKINAHTIGKRCIECEVKNALESVKGTSQKKKEKGE